MVIPNKIKNFREERGLRQVELAAKSGVSLSTINLLERGWKSLTVDVAGKLAPILKVKPTDLYSEPVETG